MESNKPSIEKLELLLELEKLKDYGMNINKNYTINDSYEEIRFEYELQKMNYEKIVWNNKVKDTAIIISFIIKHIEEKYPEVITITKEHIKKFMEEKKS